MDSICGAGIRHSAKLNEELIAANNLLHIAMAVTIGKKSVLAMPLSQFCMAMPGEPPQFLRRAASKGGVQEPGGGEHTG